MQSNYTQRVINSAVEAGNTARELVWEFLKNNWTDFKNRYPGQNNLMQIIDVSTSIIISYILTF